MEWREIPGTEGRISVSSDGGIRSNYRVMIMKDGRRKTVRGRNLIPGTLNTGYYHLRVNGIKDTLLHRIIAMVFIPNPENKPCINHKNGIRTDNRIENLEWCTVSENILHRYRVLGRTGPGLRGAKNPRSKPIAIMDNERNVVNVYGSLNEAAKLLKTPQQNISRALRKGYKLRGIFCFKQISFEEYHVLSKMIKPF